MGLEEEGPSLFQAARAAGVAFDREVEPQDNAVTLNGLRFHYLDWGNEGKPPVLLLHGGLQQGHSWDFVALALCGDYHVFALDARGHGDSQWAADGDYSLEAHQRDLESFVEALGLEQLILVGHSMGGQTSYVFTSRHPEVVKALAIVDTGPVAKRGGRSRIKRFRDLPDQLDTYQEFATRVQEYTGRSRERVMGSLRYVIRQLASGKWTWKYDKLLRDPTYRPRHPSPGRLWEYLANIRCPTLVIRGSESDIFSTETKERMLKVISQSVGAVVPEAGHLVAGDNPAGFLVVLKSWLDGV